MAYVTPSDRLRQRGYHTAASTHLRRRRPDIEYDYTGARQLEREFERSAVRPNVGFFNKYKWRIGAAIASSAVGGAIGYFSRPPAPSAPSAQTHPRGASQLINTYRRDYVEKPGYPRRGYSLKRQVWRDLYKTLKLNDIDRAPVAEYKLANGRRKKIFRTYGQRLVVGIGRDNAPVGMTLYNARGDLRGRNTWWEEQDHAMADVRRAFA